MHIGNSTKIMLIKNGRSATWLAGKLGLSQPAISQIINKKCQKCERIEELAELFGVSVVYFIGVIDEAE